MASAAVLAVCLSIAPAFPQSNAGSISGRVVDPSKAVIGGARVHAVNVENAVSQDAVSNEDGRFTLPLMPPGTYTLTVEKPGFKKVEKTGVVLAATERLFAGDVVLQVGEVVERITVSADAGQLQLKSESGERSDQITNKQLQDLALNGRNVLDMMKLIPGVVSNVSGAVSSTEGIGDFNINGTRGNQHELTVDGASNVSAGSNKSVHVTINLDAIAEVRVLSSNYQAEYGKSAGGTIQYVTKSGTREFHGSGRYFRRHDSLNANNFFSNSQNIQRPLYRYNYYGWDVGGPMLLPFTRYNRNRDKAYFFYNQEFYKQAIPASIYRVRVPTELERRGDFSQTRDGNGNRILLRDPSLSGKCTATDASACFPGNVIPASRMFNNGPAILNVYPMPNYFTDPTFNYVSQSATAYDRREDIARVDFNLDDRTRLMGRFTSNVERRMLPYGGPSSSLNYPLAPVEYPRPGLNMAINLNRVITPTLINEFIFGFSRARIQIYTDGDQATRKGKNLTFPLLYPNADPADYVPNFAFGGISNQTFASHTFTGLPFDAAVPTFSWIDNLTKVVRKHTLKTGIFVQNTGINRSAFVPVSGNISFSSDVNNPLDSGHPYANALLGVYTSYEQANNRPVSKFRFANVEGYVQDTWKVTRRFTLDYGLRMSWYQPLFDKASELGFFSPDLWDPAKAVRLYTPVLAEGQRRAVDPKNRPAGLTLANTLPAAYIGLIVPGSGDTANGIGRSSTGYLRGGIENRGVQWSPRFGFAWAATGDYKTIVRGGFGITYDRVQGDTIIEAISNPPTVLTPRLFYGQLQDLPALAAKGNAIAPPSLVGISRDGFLPTVYSYSLGVQRNVGFKTMVDVSYVGTLGRHLVQRRDLNSVPYGATFAKSGQDPTRFSGGVVPEVESGLPAVYTRAGYAFSGTQALATDFLRPYQGYGSVPLREFTGSSNYHSLQSSVRRQFAKGLAFGASYTFSKAMNTANADEDGVHPYNTRAYEYKLASYDRTHVFVANYMYEIPSLGKRLGLGRIPRLAMDGWQLSGITQFSCGAPYELGLSISGVNTGQRMTGSYTMGPRFYLKSDPAAGSGLSVIDPNAFVVPNVGDVGPYSRMYLRNPGVNNHDLSIFKNFQLGRDSRRRLQLRLEMFNAFNHTQFSGVNNGTQLTTATNATGNAVFNDFNGLRIANNLRPANSSAPLGRFFGEYNSARSPRIIQLGVKAYF